MSKKNKSKNGSKARTSRAKTSTTIRPKNRIPLIASIGSLSVIIIIAVIWFGRGSEVAISSQPESTPVQIADATGEVTPPAATPSKPTTSPAAPVTNPTPPSVQTDPKNETTSSTRGPLAHFPETLHDFGTIVQGEKVSHTFIVKNVGDEPLKLIKAKGS